MGKTLAAAQGQDNAPAETKDTVPPVITLKGEATLSLTEGDTYEEPGFIAKDDVDGDLTQLVEVSGTVATAFAGEYTLAYTVYDKAGNAGTATRTIIVSPAAGQVSSGPIITQVGSNPIILHLGGSPYTEQGAVAHDEIEGDLSAFITTEGNVDTTRAGTYQVTYSVSNSAGQSASVTREVRVLAPDTVLERTPYSFSGQGKKNEKFPYSVEAGAAGTMSLTVSGLSKAAVHVKVTDSTGSEVFSQSFAGNATKDFAVAQGGCTVEATVVEGNGKVKFDLSVLTPEVSKVTFAQEEIPLAPATSGSLEAAKPDLLGWVSIGADAIIIIGIGVLIALVARKRKAGNR